MARMPVGALVAAPHALLPAPRLPLGLAACATAVAVVAVTLVGAPGLAADLVAAGTARSIANGEQVAAALETYALENGTFPAAADAPHLQATLAPFLPTGVQLTAPGSRSSIATGQPGPVHPQAFAYAFTAESVALRYTPTGGVPTELRLTAGTGGTLTVGETTVALPW